jgi:RNA polymerase sigma-70 factor (ECF subfamily)
MGRGQREGLFESLYSAHSADVFTYALRRGVAYGDAEEVVVETFLVVWRKLHEVPNPALPWLLGVARRVVANQKRSRARRAALHIKMVRELQERPSPAGGEAGPVTRPVSADRLGEALASLSGPDREMVALVVWQGVTHEAAARILGCSRNALTKRFLRVCRDLRAQLSTDRT